MNLGTLRLYVTKLNTNDAALPGFIIFPLIIFVFLFLSHPIGFILLVFLDSL